MHLHADDTFLAPPHDVASVLPYWALTRKQRHAAMSIGRGKAFGRITGSNIDRFASNNNLDSEACRAAMAQLASDILEQVGDVVTASAHIAGVDRIGPELVRTVSANCEAMLRNMDRDGRSSGQGHPNHARMVAHGRGCRPPAKKCMLEGRFICRFGVCVRFWRLKSPYRPQDTPQSRR